MSKTNKILAVVLAIQLVLFGARIVWPDSSDDGEIAPGGALVADFAPDTVTQITITSDADEQITLAKSDDVWVLPDYDDYPVKESQVTLLLDKIEQIRADRLITQSDTSFRRLQVSPDEFVRRIALELADGSSHTLYLGSSGGGSTVHVRLDDQNFVYLTSSISSSDANAQPSGWIDTTYFSAVSSDVVGLTLQNANGTFDFTKDGDTWTVSGLGEGETLNQTNFNTVLSAITALRMTAPLSREAQDDFGMDAPQAVITLRVMETEETEDSETASSEITSLPGAATEESDATPEPTATPVQAEREYTFEIGAALDDGVVVKASNADYYVLISQTVADRFITKAQTDFVTEAPTPTPEPATATPEATATSAATATPEATATPKPTVEPPTATPEPLTVEPPTATPEPAATGDASTDEPSTGTPASDD